jgi:hypothetical protein
MTARNPVDPQNSHAASDLCSEENRRPQRRPFATRAVGNPGVLRKKRESAEAAALNAVANSNSQPKVTTGDVECIPYKGHVLKVEAQRFGWKVAIFPKSSPFALHHSPYTSEAGKRDVVIAEAKAIVDRESANEALHTGATEPAESSKRRRLALDAFLLRFRRSLTRGWATVKRVYFSVDRPRRAS